MGYDGFLKLQSINGESTDDLHQQWIEILHYDHSAVQSVVKQTSGIGGRSAAGGVMMNEFVIAKVIDSSTPLLYQFCCSGEHITEAIVELCEATGTKHCYMRWTFHNVMITSITTGGSAKDNTVARAVEHVSFYFEDVLWEYTPVDHRGKPGAALQQNWSLSAGISR